MPIPSTFQLAGAAALVAAFASGVSAQAWSHPSFQPPRIVPREFNFVVAEGGAPAGTSALIQWREQVAIRSQLTFDLGIAESDFWTAGTHVLVGGQYGHQLATASQSMPLDLLLTGGVNVAIGEPFSLFRVPVGVSVGHTFDLDGALALTPFVHPRLSYDRCIRCDEFGGDDTDLAMTFDIGADLRINPQFAVRLSAAVGGPDFFNDRWNGIYYLSDSGDSDSSLGLSVSWTPSGSRTSPEPRRRPRRN